MADIKIDDLLDDDGPVAVIIKQPLAPVDNDDRVVFPPTYPLTHLDGRVYTIRDGQYRVTMELKGEKKEDQKPGYQIDHFPDGTNICEIDSPQAQSNRIEPKFKTIDGGKLVPQIEIQVGTERVNLLEVGHRAGDAVVRMSSLAAEIHDAFTAAKSRDFFKLATLAPTSLVFGVWDSRSTYVKQQRIFKAYIRATNVREISRSAQYTPATGYVDVGAIGEAVERKTGDESNLSQEGMLHALSTQTIGGVMLTDTSRLVRTVNVNLEAIRVLRGIVPAKKTNDTKDESNAGTVNPADGTKALQRYILGLALVAAFDEPALNLREGCNLRFAQADKEKADSIGTSDVTSKLIYRSKKDDDCSFGWENVLVFAKKAKQEFFQLARIDVSAIDRPNARFETGIAEKFLDYSKTDRDKIRKLGAITRETLARFDAQGKDPFRAVTDELKQIREALGKRPGKKGPPVKNLEAFRNVSDLLGSFAEDQTLPAGAADLASKLVREAQEHDNSHNALKSIEDQIKGFKKTVKEGANPESLDSEVKEAGK